jgi:hypothetical protein
MHGKFKQRKWNITVPLLAKNAISPQIKQNVAKIYLQKGLKPS